MKRLLTTAALLALIAPMAHAATAENADAKALRAECATQHRRGPPATGQEGRRRQVSGSGIGLRTSAAKA